MKRRSAAILVACFFAVGVIAGGVAAVLTDLNGILFPPPPPAPILPCSVDEENASLCSLEAALRAVLLLRDGDYTRLADMAHPDKGIVFVPYSHVDLEANLCFSADQVRQFGTDSTAYIWGLTEGDGAPILMTPVEYFARYVYNVDYSAAKMIGVGTVLKTGNALENVADAFPDAAFIELHMPGADPQSEGLGWNSLKVVLEVQNGVEYIVALIHSEWTV